MLGLVFRNQFHKNHVISIEGFDIMKITKQDVVWAYRLMLDRDPEREEVIENYIKICNTPEQLRDIILSSEEFNERNPTFAQNYIKIPFPPEELMHLVAGLYDWGQV